MKKFQFGQYVEGNITTKPSYYSRIQGTVQGTRGEFVEISIQRMIVNGSNRWIPHPTKAILPVRKRNVKSVEIKKYLVHVEYEKDGSNLHEVVRTEAVSETHAEDKVRRQWETAIEKDSAVLSFFQGMKLKSFSAQKA